MTIPRFGLSQPEVCHALQCRACKDIKLQPKLVCLIAWQQLSSGLCYIDAWATRGCDQNSGNLSCSHDFRQRSSTLEMSEWPRQIGFDNSVVMRAEVRRSSALPSAGQCWSGLSGGMVTLHNGISASRLGQLDKPLVLCACQKTIGDKRFGCVCNSDFGAESKNSATERVLNSHNLRRPLLTRFDSKDFRAK